MSIRIGISPIAWQNDDLPDLTAAYTMEQALREAREIGYTGVERGRRSGRRTQSHEACDQGEHGPTSQQGSRHGVPSGERLLP